MPGYISITPKFDPISLQEYLTVPTMILEGRQREADKLEAYQNEAEKIRSLMGNSEEAKAIWNDYDNIMNSLADNIMDNNTGDIARINRQLRNSYRNIKAKAEDAYIRRSRYQELVDKNPDLIGEVGDFMQYYNNPEYRPTLIYGSKISKSIEALTAQTAATRVPRATNEYMGDPANKQRIYVYGITPNELDAAFSNAISGIPTTNYEQYIAQQLASSGYYNADPITKQRIAQYVYQGMQKGSGFKTGVVNELSLLNQRMNIAQKARKNNGNDDKKPKLQFQSYVSASSSDSLFDNNVSVNKTDASLDDAKLITAEEAMTKYPELFYAMFSNNKEDGKELVSNAHHYEFWEKEDKRIIGKDKTTLIIDPITTSNNTDNQDLYEDFISNEQ